MNNLRIYVCGHNHLLNEVKDKDFLRKVNLNDLDIGKYQDNQLAENRIFLTDIESSEYVGFVTAKWKQKYPSLPSLHRLNELDYHPKTLWYANKPNLACQKWEDWFNSWFPGIKFYIEEICKFTKLNTGSLPPFSNTFICHWSVYQEFIKIWRPTFEYIYEKFSFETIANTVQGGDRKRIAGYVYECISLVILSNLDVTQKLISLPKKEMKLPFKLI